ncbi:MAG: methylated-DNA--[protein]-cysteine S-methyltransferase [Polyangiaceae bacterium]|nr:methylated-DNA--[protein]-cysteine S-methyltransferase [Polyangiaceae bacterium]
MPTLPSSRRADSGGAQIRPENQVPLVAPADRLVARGSLRTPVGNLIVVATADSLVEVGFALEASTGADNRGRGDRRSRALVTAALRELAEYLAGRRRRFELPLAEAPTPFQAEVRRVLLTVPFGETVTYGQLAARLGRPGASRAVGGANHRNPIGVIIPCHRVIGRNGALTGYASGLSRKAWLLAHEARYRS